MSILGDDRSEELGPPRPLAVAYICIPSFFDAADSQWKRQIQERANREGFAIEHWYTDGGHRQEALQALERRLQWAPSVGAIFVPDVTMLRGLWPAWEGLEVEQDVERRVLAEQLGRQIFVLSDDFAPILPPVPMQEQPRVSSSRGWWRRRAGSSSR